MEAGRTDEVARFQINGDQRSFAFQSPIEECPENARLMTVRLRVPFPNEGIRGHCIQVPIVFRPEWSELQTPAVQRRLKVNSIVDARNLVKHGPRQGTGISCLVRLPAE